MPKVDKSEIKVISDRIQEDPEISAMVTRMEAEADEEIAGKVTLQWGPKQVALAREAATRMGVPLHAYVKQVVYRQAIEDIARANEVLGRPQESSDQDAPVQRKAGAQ